MKLGKNSIVVIALSVLILVGLYWYFFAGPGSSNAPPLSATATQTDTQTQFQSLIAQLQSINFDTSIFSDPRFTSLVDITTAITPETLGRNDPFAPVPGITATN